MTINYSEGGTSYRHEHLPELIKQRLNPLITVIERDGIYDLDVRNITNTVKDHTYESLKRAMKGSELFTFAFAGQTPILHLAFFDDGSNIYEVFPDIRVDPYDPANRQHINSIHESLGLTVPENGSPRLNSQFDVYLNGQKLEELRARDIDDLFTIGANRFFVKRDVDDNYAI